MVAGPESIERVRYRFGLDVRFVIPLAVKRRPVVGKVAVDRVVARRAVGGERTRRVRASVAGVFD